MYCHKCGAQLSDDANFCAKCGTNTASSRPTISVTPNPSIVISETQAAHSRREVEFDQSSGFFVKLLRGDYGLLKTYWLYGAVVTLVANALVALLSPPPRLVGVLTLAFAAYSAVWAVGTWRAATRYAGPPVWAVLAKIICVICWFMVAVGVVLGIKLVVATTSEGTTHGLQWAESDNGGDITWNDAMAYCARNGKGWRLPTVAELKETYKTGQLTPCGGYMCKAATGSRLTGLFFWSNESVDSSGAWIVELGTGTRSNNSMDFSGGRRALCVRP